MASSSLIRLGGLATMAGGVAWVVLWLPGEPLALIIPLYVADNIVIGLLELGAMVAIASLHILQRERYGFGGALASLAAFIGLGLALLAQVVGYGATGTTGWRIILPPILLGSGLLLATVGLIALGAVSIGAGSLPRWGGVALILGSPPFALVGTTFLHFVGGVAMVPVGVAWVMVGYAVFRAGTRRSERPSRVR